MNAAMGLLSYAVGLLFVMAGAAKLVDPAVFETQIRAYQFLPAMSGRLLAVYLPWLEMVVGLAIFFRRLRAPAAGILLGLMVLFIVAMLSAWFRDIDIKCGCFGFELNWHVTWLLVRDALIVIVLAAILSVECRGHFSKVTG